MKRPRRVVAKPGELRIAWGKEPHESPSLVYAWGGEGAEKHDSMLLMRALGLTINTRIGINQTLIKELEDRGYDLTTLKFSIQKKVPA